MAYKPSPCGTYDDVSASAILVGNFGNSIRCESCVDRCGSNVDMDGDNIHRFHYAELSREQYLNGASISFQWTKAFCSTRHEDHLRTSPLFPPPYREVCFRLVSASCVPHQIDKGTSCAKQPPLPIHSRDLQSTYPEAPHINFWRDYLHKSPWRPVQSSCRQRPAALKLSRGLFHHSLAVLGQRKQHNSISGRRDCVDSYQIWTPSRFPYPR